MEIFTNLSCQNESQMVVMMSPQQCKSIAKVFEIDLSIDLLTVEGFEVFVVGTQGITLKASISQSNVSFTLTQCMLLLHEFVAWERFQFISLRIDYKMLLPNNICNNFNKTFIILFDWFLQSLNVGFDTNSTLDNSLLNRWIKNSWNVLKQFVGMIDFDFCLDLYHRYTTKRCFVKICGSVPSGDTCHFNFQMCTQKNITRTFFSLW